MKFPPAVGVPEIAPAEDRLRPVVSAPDVTAKVQGPTQPVAESVALYAAATEPFGREAGAMSETPRYVKSFADPTAELVPPDVVTVTSEGPSAPAGDVAVIDVALLIVKALAGVPPKFIAVAPVKFVPVRFTEVPPLAGPEFGLSPVTVGAGTT